MRWMLMVMAVASCAGSDAERVVGPDGSGNWVSVSCKRSMTHCYERAGEECPHGYEVADRGGHDGTLAHMDRNGGYAVPTFNGEMLIRCKGKPAGDYWPQGVE